MDDILGRLKASFRQALALPLGASLLFAMPASTNYQLKDFGYGGGGVANGTSSNYAIEGIAGEQNATQLDGATYDLGPGLQFTNQANVPPAPTFTNPSNYYNKLALTLATGGNPTDTLFAIAISTDNFVTTNYVQSDNTVGATLGLEDYQTYSAWGGGSGFTVIGLTASTTYKVKVKAWQGKFTETGYGPEATAATVGARLTFDIDVSASNSETSAPYTTNIGDLIAGTVTDSPEKVWVDFDTNGESGGRVYVVASNAGLQSSRAGYTISAVTGNLTSLTEGFGAQSDTATNGLSEVALYNQTGNTVGTVDTTIREVFTASAPTASGRGSFLLKAKSSAVTPAASDYTETLTVVASASF
jgi:hypothetical protein